MQSGVQAFVPREGDHAPAAEVGCRGDGEPGRSDSELSDTGAVWWPRRDGGPRLRWPHGGIVLEVRQSCPAGPGASCTCDFQIPRSHSGEGVTRNR